MHIVVILFRSIFGTMSFDCSSDQELSSSLNVQIACRVRFVTGLSSLAIPLIPFVGIYIINSSDEKSINIDTQKKKLLYVLKS